MIFQHKPIKNIFNFAENFQNLQQKSIHSESEILSHVNE